MNLIVKSLFVPVLLFSFSCVKTVKFPVSASAPAADISVTKKQDANKNYIIEVKGKNLASPERLNPPKNNYSVWIVTVDGDIKNLGQLINKNGESVDLKATTPFDPKEIFITAEERGDVSYPSGVEISRTSFK